jgi:PAS domain-containing protein
MIGRGAYAHAVPFYGKRRAMIADLLLHPDPNTESLYPSLRREDDMITAEGVLTIGGKRHIFLARASFLFDEHGRIAGAIESLRDITPLKQSEEKLARIIHQLPLGLQIFRLCSDGRLVCHDGNLASEEITGIRGRCIPGKTIDEIFSDDYAQRITVISKKIAMEGGRDRIDNVCLHGDGSGARHTLMIFQIDPGEIALLYV